MRRQMEERLATLRSDYEKGQTQLRQLELQSSSLRETLLRISGALMVLEELLSLSMPLMSRDGHQAEVVSGDTEPLSSAHNEQLFGSNKEN
jgi:predicted nuclease with TOPRIM domain